MIVRVGLSSHARSAPFLLWCRTALSVSKTHRCLSTTSNPISASFLRGGTSKGIYLNRADLPDDVARWDSIFLGIMGSPDPKYGRQLNGMGGGISSLSKICVVGSPSKEQQAEGIDVVYTFAQVGIRDEVIDYSGNCGNLSSMIGVFALDEGIVPVPRILESNSRIPTATIRSYNTNTQKCIDTTFPVSQHEGVYAATLDLEQEVIAGVSGKASRIVLDFVSPSGARTGKLLPSSQPTDTLPFVSTEGVRSDVSVSFVDATNPTVFVASDGLRRALGLVDTERLDLNSVPVELAVEQLRRLGAERMGLDPETQAQPKIAIISEPMPDDEDADIIVNAYSMGVPHRAVPMTVGLCLGVAAGVEGTIPWSIVNSKTGTPTPPEGDRMVRIRHPGGVVVVGSIIQDGVVVSAKVIRTGRRLMRGVVWW